VVGDRVWVTSIGCEDDIAVPSDVRRRVCLNASLSVKFVELDITYTSDQCACYTQNSAKNLPLWTSSIQACQSAGVGVP
jgi:hypothetical protein